MRNGNALPLEQSGPPTWDELIEADVLALEQERDCECIWFRSSTGPDGKKGAPALCQEQGCTGHDECCETYQPKGGLND